ncbi:armadillo repeat-containing X-linked protein 1-like [Haliotis asinina]|uniref:armadillo repeat-containing X-linked protein 1-like n=1 Tax=Haliotis asinina TaxID=109174 RepID=UPI003531F2C7
MVNQDNTKIGVGAFAVFGTALLAYLLYKQWKKRKDEESNGGNGDTVGGDYPVVRKRTSNRGRNGRFVSDPGRMFSSTDRVMPVPSGATDNMEGIFKRHSTGARISQIPKPANSGSKVNEAKRQVKSSDRENVVSPKLNEPDIIPSMEKQTQIEPPKQEIKDERYEDAKEKKKNSKRKAEEQAGSVSGVSTPESSSPSKSKKVPVNVQAASTKEPAQQAVKPLEVEASQVTEQTLPSQAGEAAANEGGAGEAMAVPVDPQLEDQSVMLTGDSEGSDIGAGDTLAEDYQFVSKAGITLSPSSSAGSSPAKSPLKTDKKQDSVSEKAEAKPTETSSQASEKSKSSKMSSETLEDELDSDVITRALLQVQKTPSTVDKKVIKVLVDLLKVPEQKLLLTGLESIVRCAAFSANQKALRENRCPEELLRLLQVHSKAIVGGTAITESILVATNNAIMNLSMDVANQAKLEVCIPILIDLVMHEGMSSNVKLSSLQPLTNLSTTSTYHGQYTRAVQQLYDLLDVGNRVVRIQAIKLLVNLSCNSEMVKHLLAAKAPTCMMSLLEKTADPNMSLRLITLLANIVSTAQKEDVTSSSLPTDDKAASPETMYSAIFGVNNLSQIRSKVYPLTRHDSEDISQQAARLYKSLPSC